MSKFIVLAVALAVASAVTCPGYLYSDNNWPKSVDCSSSLPTPPAGTCGFAQYIAPHEGCSYCAYKDSLGLPTIGIGYLLQKGQDQPLPAGLNFEKLATGNEALNNEEVVQMFNADVQAAIQLDQQIFSNWNQLCCNVEMVLVDMTFVMMYKLKQFTHLIAAVESNNWEAAAASIQGSLWCKQVHTRCTDDVNRMLKGCPAGGNPKPTPTPNNNGNSNANNSNQGSESAAPASSKSASQESQSQSQQQQASSSAKSSAQASNPNASSQSSAKTSAQASNPNTSAPSSTKTSAQGVQESDTQTQNSNPSSHGTTSNF